MNVSLDKEPRLDRSKVKLGTIISVTSENGSKKLNYLVIYDTSRNRYTTLNMQNNKLVNSLFYADEPSGLLDVVLENFTKTSITKVELIQEDEYKVVRA
jgi:hypothetical protein